jgi:alpha-beta hydrolase superfamily lysophospholipase
MFLHGLHSDMTGTKATALAAWAEQTGRAFLGLDWYGHGQSSET